MAELVPEMSEVTREEKRFYSVFLHVLLLRNFMS